MRLVVEVRAGLYCFVVTHATIHIGCQGYAVVILDHRVLTAQRAMIADRAISFVLGKISRFHRHLRLVLSFKNKIVFLRFILAVPRLHCIS